MGQAHGVHRHADVVSQNGNVVPGFALRVSGGLWSFALARDDTAAAVVDAATSAGAVATDRHRVQLGRAMRAAVWDDHLTGAVDDVRVHGWALTAADVNALFTGGAVSAGPPAAPAPMTAERSGALQGDEQGQTASTAVAFGGVANAFNATAVGSAPAAFTMECWFRASGTSGGTLLAFAAAPTGGSSVLAADRAVYVAAAGRLSFGVTTPGGPVVVRSNDAWADGAWHHVAATAGPGGTRLYVDGSLVASDPSTAATTPAGWWRWGGAPLSGWPHRPANDYLTGSLDEVAFYPTQLSVQDVAWHAHADH